MFCARDQYSRLAFRQGLIVTADNRRDSSVEFSLLFPVFEHHPVSLHLTFSSTSQFSLFPEGGSICWKQRLCRCQKTFQFGDPPSGWGELSLQRAATSQVRPSGLRSLPAHTPLLSNADEGRARLSSPNKRRLECAALFCMSCVTSAVRVSCSFRDELLFNEQLYVRNVVFITLLRYVDNIQPQTHLHRHTLRGRNGWPFNFGSRLQIKDQSLMI